MNTTNRWTYEAIAHDIRVSALALAVALGITPLAYADGCVKAPSGIVGWWKGENNAMDSANHGDGILRNGVVYKTGAVGRSFGVDGIDDIIEVSNTERLNLTDVVSMEAWIFRTSPSWPQHIAGKREGCSGGPFYQLAIGSGAIPPEAVPLNQWVHIAEVSDVTAGHTTKYVNGVVVSEYDFGGFSYGPNNANFTIGNSGTCEPFKGRIDELSVYDRALTADEIVKIYLSGPIGKCSNLGGSISASVDGVYPRSGFLACENVTTGQSVTVPLVKGVTMANCQSEGLVVTKGDTIKARFIVNGVAE